ncbi:hypothetical protein [Streptomyces sp. 769]|uniref:hypothetical protein n=1 Tax=Streptomyces sp. 769 TaxID=1262452 RepID=UPI0005820C6E|nr:hypothetical protein [Streptomyces sp. 769]AJC52830.1 hypothetical protein GZL_00222 [Streptomyces sp. 769]
MHDTVTLADDPDLAHLIDLIDILPRPSVTSFWGEGDHNIVSKIGYRFEEILSGRGGVADVDCHAVYVLKYLGHGNKHIPEDHITRHPTGAHGLPAAGHAWVEDATRTAWTLATRYSLRRRRGARSTPGKAWIEE